MKNICIGCLLLLTIMSIAAQDNTLLKKNHEKMIQYSGDKHFLKGQHYFAVSNNIPVSVFTVKNQRSIYTETKESKFYRVIEAKTAKNKTTLSFSEKIAKGQRIYTMRYNITFIVSGKSSGYFVMLDEESDFIATKIDKQKVLSCILKYAAQLYQPVLKCFQQTNFMECIKILQPAIEVYNCITGTKSETVFHIPVKNKNRAIITKTIYFSWSWGYSTPLKSKPVYVEMPHTIIGFDSVSLSGCKNAWNIIISGNVIGNNVAAVSLAKVSYMCYPRFWSSRVSGSIRCVMQK